MATASKKPWPRAAKYVVCPMYGADMYLIQDRKAWCRACDFLGIEAHDDAAGKALLAAHNKSGDIVFLVGVFDGQISTLVHECGHVALWVCNHVGIRWQHKSAEEAYCYLLQTLFELFLPLMEPA